LLEIETPILKRTSQKTLSACTNLMPLTMVTPMSPESLAIYKIHLKTAPLLPTNISESERNMMIFDEESGSFFHIIISNGNLFEVHADEKEIKAISTKRAKYPQGYSHRGEQGVGGDCHRHFSCERQHSS
jgi:hypothetical protein